MYGSAMRRLAKSDVSALFQLQVNAELPIPFVLPFRLPPQAPSKAEKVREREAGGEFNSFLQAERKSKSKGDRAPFLPLPSLKSCKHRPLETVVSLWAAKWSFLCGTRQSKKTTRGGGGGGRKGLYTLSFYAHELYHSFVAVVYSPVPDFLRKLW